MSCLVVRRFVLTYNIVKILEKRFLRKWIGQIIRPNMYTFLVYFYCLVSLYIWSANYIVSQRTSTSIVIQYSSANNGKNCSLSKSHGLPKSITSIMIQYLSTNFWQIYSNSVGHYFKWIRRITLKLTAKLKSPIKPSTNTYMH